MTLDIQTFASKKEAEIEIKNRAGVFRAMYPDKLSDGTFQITFVNGEDDPDNSDESKQREVTQKTNQDRLEVLQTKLDDDTINFVQLKEYLRLS